MNGVEIKVNFDVGCTLGNTGLFFCQKCEGIFDGKISADLCCTRDGLRVAPLGNMQMAVKDFKKIQEQVRQRKRS